MHSTLWPEKLNGKDHLKKRRRRYEGNIKRDLREIGREFVSWIHVDKRRAVINMGMSRQVP
jgi:hypothetical protein